MSATAVRSDTIGHMNSAEWAPIGGAMQARWWSFPIPPVAHDQYVEDLRDLDAAAVKAAVDTLAAEGRERPPTSGQIRRKVAEMELDAPTWDQVLLSLSQRRATAEERAARVEAWVCPASACDGSGMVVADEQRSATVCVCRPARVAAARGLDQLHPLVAEFVDEGHVSTHDFAQLLDAGNSTTAAQVRMRWEQFAGRAIAARVAAGLPDGQLPASRALKRADEERRERHGEPRRMDVVAALESGQ